ncbi:alpha,alpha-trehalase nth1 [Saitoella coloradoensis]
MKAIPVKLEPGIPPANWEKVYRLIEQMRKTGPPAPVDTMGCERLADQDADPKVKRFQTLISLMLSSQTKDTVNAIAMANLKSQLPGGLCLESILAVADAELNAMIGMVGFHRRKTEYIKKTAVILRDQWAGDIPDTIEGLVALPGVGPKMGYLTLTAAWNKTTGIGVDVHVHRITNLLGWHKTNTPERTRAALESWLPSDKWGPINPLLVGFGQTICKPVGRLCSQCTLSTGLCPSVTYSAPKKKGTDKKLEGETGTDLDAVTDTKLEKDVGIKIEDMEDLVK